MPDVTYEQLFDILRREKSRDELQQLDAHFLDAARDFLAAKEDTIRAANVHGTESLGAQRAGIEYQNVKKILRELYERRERKIVTMAMHRTRTENAMIEAGALLADERRLLDALVGLLTETRVSTLGKAGVTDRNGMGVPQPQSYDQDIVKTTPEEADEAEAPPVDVDNGDTFSGTEQHMAVRFTARVPKFMGKDLRVFGPYDEGMTAELPEEVAQVLIRKGRAEPAQ